MVNQNGVNVNIELLKEGLGALYLKQSGCKKLLPYENEAKEQSLNIWSDATFMLPWDFRKNKTLSG